MPRLPPVASACARIKNRAKATGRAANSKAQSKLQFRLHLDGADQVRLGIQGTHAAHPCILLPRIAADISFPKQLCSLAAAALIILGSVTISSAQTKVGSEFQINTFTSGDQITPSVAGLNDGGFVVSWDSELEGHFGPGIYGQRYDAMGNPVGGEFKSSINIGADPVQPSATALSDGGFIVAWVLRDWRYGVHYQRYKSDGGRVGHELRADSPAGFRNAPTTMGAVAGLKTGGFVFNWQTFILRSGVEPAIAGALYNAAGGRVGSQYLLSKGGRLNEAQGSFVAALNDGGFVFTWTSVKHGLTGWNVFAQRYLSSGAPAGAVFHVNTGINSAQRPVVAGLAQGGFVVAWQSLSQNGSSWAVVAQLYDAAGTPVGSKFVVNTTTVGEQSTPSVASLADGGFVVAWQSETASGFDIFAQRYDASGAPVGTEFQVNTNTAGDQVTPSVAALGNGGFVITWSSFQQHGSGWGIYGQCYAP